MKVNDFIGMKVIDIEAKEVGKVEDLAVLMKECLIEQIIISTGSTLSKKFFAVGDEDLAAIGDYVQLKLDGNAIENKKVDKIDDLVSKEARLKNVIGKVVIAQGGMEVGKIEDLVVEPAKCLINNVIISMGGTFNRKQVIISNDDIAEIGDYVLLKLSKEQLEQIIVD
jgi:sporulation protein YlmC with PRC-barrel domain